jgi:DNA-binding MarR family transcriptional regulator
MRTDEVADVQRLFPQIYLACHIHHVRARSTRWRLSSYDSSVLMHLDRDTGMSPGDLAKHLGVAASTLSATTGRLMRLGYLTVHTPARDRRARELRLTSLGAEATAATSVLDAERTAAMLALLSRSDRAKAIGGLALLAQAARRLRPRRRSR